MRDDGGGTEGSHQGGGMRDEGEDHASLHFDVLRLDELRPTGGLLGHVSRQLLGRARGRFGALAHETLVDIG